MDRNIEDMLEKSEIDITRQRIEMYEDMIKSSNKSIKFFSILLIPLIIICCTYKLSMVNVVISIVCISFYLININNMINNKKDMERTLMRIKIDLSISQFTKK